MVKCEKEENYNIKDAILIARKKRKETQKNWKIAEKAISR
jgi:hypothetical protein